MKRIVLSVLIVLFVFSGFVAAGTYKAVPAHAVTLNGLCDLSNNYQDCAREASPYFDDWARDISGDSNQQMGRSYQGQVSNGNCWPFTCGSGNNAALDNTAVYKIYNVHSGRCLASNDTTWNVYSANCSANGTNWVWKGSSSNAYLVNVYQVNNHGGRSDWWTLDKHGLYNSLSVYDNGFRPWGMVSVIG
jgi:hypothetical protein